MISAKTGLGVPEVLEAIVTRLPPPKGDRDAPLKALLVDSWYDAYLGVVVLVRIFDGVLKKGQRIRMMGTDAAYEVDRVGVFTPKLTLVDELGPGEIGILTASIKEVADTRVGDTITDDRKPIDRGAARLPAGDPGGVLRPVPGRRRGLRGPARRDGQAAPQRRELFATRWRRSAALGFGFRCGFLGLLHLEIIQERLEREFNLDLIATAPSVIYKIKLRNGGDDRAPQSGRHARPGEDPGDRGAVDRGDHPDARRISRRACSSCARTAAAAQIELTYVGTRAHGEIRPAAQRGGVRFLRPAEIGVEGLRLVRLSPHRLPPADLVKMQILVNAEPVDALSMLVHRTRAEQRGRAMVEKLKELIPPHMFQVPIQAAIGGKIIARETVRAFRKDVTAKCYGGDVTRKRKLLDKQKEGKKRMRQFGKVDIPQEAFIAALKVDV